MDRRAGVVARVLLIAGAVAAFGAAAPARVAAPPASPLRAMRWLAPGVDPVAALTTRPTECLTPGATPETRAAIEIGRAAFRSPLLLGGQAARAGLSCEACHRNGRGNPDFLFPGVSGGAGTADVTASLFSSHRGDGIDNPKPIPDLSGPRDRLKISRGPASPDLAKFIHGLVVEEFDGAEPPPAVLAGLAAYVRALAPAACPAAARERVQVRQAVDDARQAVAAAEAALANGDRATSAAMLIAARAQLGAINERYAGAALARDRALLLAADGELLRALAEVRAGDAKAAARLAAWRREARSWTRRLAADEPWSFYDPGTLAGAAGQK